MGSDHPSRLSRRALVSVAFDINYARMDMESDRERRASIPSFTVRRQGDNSRTNRPIPPCFCLCSHIADPMSGPWFLLAAASMAFANIVVVLRRERFADFQTMLFRVSMLTGWVLLASLALGFAVEPPTLD